MSIIAQHINNIKLIDGHEHLIPQKDRQKMNSDFFDLLHYLQSDLITAGIDSAFFDKKKNQMSDREKAAVFLKYWVKTKNTTYAQMLRWAVEDIYGMKDWTVDGICHLNEQVKQASQDPLLYHKILKEKAGIDLAFTLIFTTKVDFELFRPVMWTDHVFKLRTLQEIINLEKEADMTIYELDDLVSAMDTLIERYVNEGMVATKIGAAYWRTLAVEKPTKEAAAQAFNKIKANHLGEWIPQEEAKPLQDYMIHRVIQASIKHELPIQIHTGHQEPSVSGNGNILTHSQVTDLIPLLLEYSQAKFVLLHGGYPYYNEYLSIVKNFPNAYADLTWCYILSPTATKQMLMQMIEMVPQSKILGFGGDYSQVEGTYAHAKLARRILTEALTAKVELGDMTVKEACEFANHVLRNNLIELYQLELDPISLEKEENDV
ncbi:amidohydrolase family protein [Gracilibacillus alcaliphilus]|uniref:amidohydrolase family protein n=1 Tax=Gracilibacillus alcaliphilus TaxID=1401441 RepID=UPI001957F92A|nr:amidohydrolase family protein [Gracilibacillus alcaliphilus]MBM7677569.1 putative TIM-barrel fold metal-dependent hydrolase [Gracilibacillus alcaliphilus]